MELEAEKGRCEGEAQEKLGEPVVSNIGQVWKTISPLWDACPMDARPCSGFLLHVAPFESCQPAPHAWADSGGGEGGIARVVGYLPYSRMRGSMKLGEWGERGVDWKSVSEKSNILLLNLAGFGSQTLSSEHSVHFSSCCCLGCLLSSWQMRGSCVQWFNTFTQRTKYIHIQYIVYTHTHIFYMLSIIAGKTKVL